MRLVGLLYASISARLGEASAFHRAGLDSLASWDRRWPRGFVTSCALAWRGQHWEFLPVPYQRAESSPASPSCAADCGGQSSGPSCLQSPGGGVLHSLPLRWLPSVRLLHLTQWERAPWLLLPVAAPCISWLTAGPSPSAGLWPGGRRRMLGSVVLPLGRPDGKLSGSESCSPGELVPA